MFANTAFPYSDICIIVLKLYSIALNYIHCYTFLLLQKVYSLLPSIYARILLFRILYSIASSRFPLWKRRNIWARKKMKKGLLCILFLFFFFIKIVAFFRHLSKNRYFCAIWNLVCSTKIDLLNKAVLLFHFDRDESFGSKRKLVQSYWPFFAS